MEQEPQQNRAEEMLAVEIGKLKKAVVYIEKAEQTANQSTQKYKELLTQYEQLQNELRLQKEKVKEVLELTSDRKDAAINNSNSFDRLMVDYEELRLGWSIEKGKLRKVEIMANNAGELAKSSNELVQQLILDQDKRRSELKVSENIILGYKEIANVQLRKVEQAVKRMEDKLKKASSTDSSDKETQRLKERLSNLERNNLFLWILAGLALLITLINLFLAM